MQPYEDLTLSEALRDPMILAVAHADGVTTVELGRVLQSAAKRLGARARPADTARRHGSEAETVSFPMMLRRSPPAVSQCCGFF